MDFAFDERQEMARTQLRTFLANECPPALVREAEDKALDACPDLYRKLGELGWFGLRLPPEYCGVGGTWVDMASFHEEAGRAMLPGPYHAMGLAAQIVLAFADESFKKQLLPPIARGEVDLSLALSEPETGADPALIATSTSRRGRNYYVNGRKLFVSHLGLANQVLVVSGGEDGDLDLCLVDKLARGLTFNRLDSMSGERTYEAFFQDVPVRKGQLAGRCSRDQLRDVLNKMKIMRCAQMAGSAEKALEMAVDYSKERKAMDRPIGSFQVLQHKMADMAMAIDASKAVVYEVAWMNDEEIPSAREAAIALMQAGKWCNWVITQSAHIHGAVSFFKDHDLSWQFRRTKAAQLDLGPIDVIREDLLQAIGI